MFLITDTVGRKKVDIRPIPEGRKRQVTFMKRKTGLLKKAMELSILCQCEMAVVIFNHNGRLYDYGSTNIHKTIRRFKNKGKPDGSYDLEVRRCSKQRRALGCGRGRSRCCSPHRVLLADLLVHDCDWVRFRMTSQPMRHRSRCRLR